MEIALPRSKKLPMQLSQEKRNVVEDYGEFELFTCLTLILRLINPLHAAALLAMPISSKATLRERMRSTRLLEACKLVADEATKHIKVYLITPDEDGALNEIDGPPRRLDKS